MASRSFHLEKHQVSLGWDASLRPALTIASGTEISIDVVDASGGQIGPASTVDAVAELDFARVNPVSGPVHVEGARPGDVLQVDILEIAPASWGWTALIPGFGLLADEFPTPWLHIWKVESGRAAFRNGIVVPTAPFCGVLGVTPAEPGLHSVVPPRRVGGNLDIKQLGEGATLYLPIETAGALFGVGDTHAAQGDGEVCGTAIEAPLAVNLRLTIRRDITVQGPEFEVRRPLERPSAAAAGYFVTTGVAPDLMDATRQAIQRMIERLGAGFGLGPEDAYALCSVAVDLKISEVVDTPNWVVSAFCPRDLFA